VNTRSEQLAQKRVEREAKQKEFSKQQQLREDRLKRLRETVAIIVERYELAIQTAFALADLDQEM